jgi:hypothetical protein
MDYFLQQAAKQGVPLTLVKFDEGKHGFDFKVNSFPCVRPKGIEIIQQV